MKNNNNILFNDLKGPAMLHMTEFNAAFKRVLESGWFILGKEVAEFEDDFGNYLNAKYCIGVANGLEALQISLMSLEIGKGDEVITTPISAVATTLSILSVGALPVFVDTDENGLMDVRKIEKVITNKTRAILPVHLYGQSVDLLTMQNICKKYKLFLIEDACQAHGSRFDKKYLGTIGDIGCFSFYPTKNLGCFGDGGAIVTNDENIYEICKQIRDYGQKDKYVHERYGLNSRLDEVQAAILKVKLKYLDEENEKRRMLAKRYVSALKDIKQIKFVGLSQYDQSNHHLVIVRVKERHKLVDHLKSNGISTAIHYPSTIPDQPFLKGSYKNIDIKEAKSFVKDVLTLPCNLFMNEGSIDDVSQKIIEFYN